MTHEYKNKIKINKKTFLKTSPKTCPKSMIFPSPENSQKPTKSLYFCNFRPRKIDQKIEQPGLTLEREARLIVEGILR